MCLASGCCPCPAGRAVVNGAMSTGFLDDLAGRHRGELARLAAMTAAETGAVIKADGYGTGAGRLARALAHAGCRTFFVAAAEEGRRCARRWARGPRFWCSWPYARDTDMLADLALTPLLNSVEQLSRHLESLPGQAFGLAAGYRHEPAGPGMAGLGRGGRDRASGRTRAVDEPSGLRR